MQEAGGGGGGAGGTMGRGVAEPGKRWRGEEGAEWGSGGGGGGGGGVSEGAGT